MIKKITLINFQIHKRLEIEFDKNFTVIIGSNNNGKSSIIRAINWVFYNLPSGDWMRRINKDDELENTKVKILFDDGTVISREKGDKINKYVVDGDEYENFGYGVPEKVIEKLKIFPFKTNKISFNINLSMQEEQPFLIHESAPVKSSIIDALTGNSIIQKSISEFNKESTQCSREETRISSEISEDENALAIIPNIDKAQTYIDEAKCFTDSYERLEKEIERLLKISGDLVINRFKVNSYKEIDILKIESRVERINNLDKEIKELKSLDLNLKKVFKVFDFKIPNLDDVEKLIEDLEKKELEYEKLRKLDLDLESQNNIVDQTKVELKNLEKDLEEFYKQNPSCPTCGKGWDK